MAGTGNSLENPSSSNESPRIAVFPKGQTPWRIDWFGDIAFPDRSVRRKQPSVFIHLSRVTDSRFRDDPAVLLSAHSTVSPNFQRRVWVSVGTLPLLRIGDVWRDGQLDVRPDYQLEEFTDIHIDQSTTTLIKAGLNLDEGGFLLPLSEHPWHMQCTQSYCVMVDLPGARRLIIPCMELVRFYFGSSSSLITKLFLPPLARDSLYENATLNTKSGRLVLALAEKMSGASAADIGRLHLEPAAWRAAAHVGASILKASVANHAVYPQALFPFEGKSTLVASGKWLSFADQPQATFLVYNLRSCAHPFPFRSLRYEAKGGRPKPPPPEGGAANSNANQTLASAKDAKDQLIAEHDPSNNLAPRTRSFQVEPRFPDLIPKSIWKSKSISLEDQAARRKSKAAPVESAALGEPGSERRTRPMDLALLATSEFWKSQLIPEFLRDTVFQLRFLQGITVELLTESGHDGWTVPISILSDEDGEINSQLFITEPGGSSRLRRASVFAFERDNDHVCAVVIESDPIHVKFYPTTGQDSNEVWETLRCAAVDFLKGSDSDLEGLGLSDLIHWVFDLVER
ncbi:hypothetical protein [Rhodoferax ferrireducens]|uniref:hypothetical protein n=1 Tax=Rhodoferax ferrireducens TaxID=192843 RepID=UPI003BB6F904